MSIKSEAGIYKILEDRLRKAKDPLTCVDLFEDSSVKKYAASANKVSDFLGHMWRKGLITRYHAPKTSTSFARFAYEWKKANDLPETPRVILAPERSTGKKPEIEIFEKDGAVFLEVAGFTVTISRK